MRFPWKKHIFKSFLQWCRPALSQKPPFTIGFSYLLITVGICYCTARWQKINKPWQKNPDKLTSALLLLLLTSKPFYGGPLLDTRCTQFKCDSPRYRWQALKGCLVKRYWVLLCYMSKYTISYTWSSRRPSGWKILPAQSASLALQVCLSKK